MRALVGYTGFVGSNLYKPGRFDRVFRSTDIGQAFGLEPDLLVYAGVRAEKYLANTEPERDLSNIRQAFEQIKRIKPRKLILISTVDVYAAPAGVDENSDIISAAGGAYGRNRYELERMVRSAYPDALIVRLPALYGENLKKNFLYDYIHRIPAVLKADKYNGLSAQSGLIRRVYVPRDNGFYKYAGQPEQDEAVKEEFGRLGFSALQFTDSRSQFQFYPLSCLWEHLCAAMEASLKLLNITTEPIRAGELYRMWEGKEFVNEMTADFPRYDCRSIHAERFGGRNGYLFDKEFILKDMQRFVQKELSK